MRPRLLIIALSDAARDPRVDRQVRFLRDEYDVTVAALAPSSEPGVGFVQVPTPPPPSRLTRWPRRAARGALLVGRRFDAFHRTLYRHVTDALAATRADVLLANDLDALPCAFEAARGAPVVFDAHEYAPREHDERLLWRAFYGPYRAHLCRANIPRAAGFMTVCEGIADAYARDTGVRPVVVTNAPPYAEQAPARLGVGERTIRLVHHGVAMSARGLEGLLDALDLLDDRFTLDLLLVEYAPERAYLERLRARAARDSRVRVLPPVPMRELARRLNEYDVGAYLLHPANFNHTHSLPNKLFEFIQARLAVAIGPSVEMRRVVEDHGCGVVSADFSPASFAATLRALDRPTIDRLKQRAHAAARELCAERNRERVLALVRGALERR